MASESDGKGPPKQEIAPRGIPSGEALGIPRVERGPTGAEDGYGRPILNPELLPRRSSVPTGIVGPRPSVATPSDGPPPGSSTSAGAAGAPGPTGSTGAPGAQGPTGPTGATGAQGAQGTQGEQSATGATGATGAPGAQGVTGAQGAFGTSGPSGTQGASGAQGPEVGPVAVGAVTRPSGARSQSAAGAVRTAPQVGGADRDGDAASPAAGSDTPNEPVRRDLRVKLGGGSYGVQGNDVDLHVNRVAKVSDPPHAAAELSPFGASGTGHVDNSIRSVPTTEQPTRDAYEPAQEAGKVIEATGQVNVELNVSAKAEATRAPQPARPESVSDVATDSDTLGFRPYVVAVSTFLLNQGTKPPFAMSIEGEWGSGKSSFMRQLERALRADAAPPKMPPKVVHFSPWRHEKNESLWAAFALQFVKECRPDGWWNRRVASVRLASRQFDFAEGWRPLLGLVVALACALVFPVAFIVKLFSPELEDGTTEVTKWVDYVKTWAPPLLSGGGVVGIAYAAFRATKGNLDFKLQRYLRRPDYPNKLSFLTTFHEDFTDYVETHVRPGERVFVMIDDLDRCAPQQAAELLTAINLMIPDTLPLIFIIAIDRLKVAAGVAASHEKLLPFVMAGREEGNTGKIDPSAAVSYGYEFLEKFVQLPFRLPRPRSAAIGTFVAELVGAPQESSAGRQQKKLGDVVADDPMVQELMREVAPTLANNPRRLKQFLNLFRLRHYVLESTGALDGGRGPATLRALATVVTLEIRWPRLLEAIEVRPALLGEIRAHLDGGKASASPALDLQQWLRAADLLAFLRRAAPDWAILETMFGDAVSGAAQPDA
jgi:hypothetical protein